MRRRYKDRPTWADMAGVIVITMITTIAVVKCLEYLFR